MNIPPEVARAQGHHGIKGASHGIKGGRPRLPLTDEERKEHRRKQQEAWRRRNGIFPKKVLTWEERREIDRQRRARYWDGEYRHVWRKLPGIPLTPNEFARRQPVFLRWVQACQRRNFPLAWPVDFVREHYRAIRRQEREEWLRRLKEEHDEGQDGDEDEEPLPDVAERKPRKRRTRDGWQAYVGDLLPMESPRVGRNDPCPCGSGRKFKKCCGP